MVLSSRRIKVRAAPEAPEKHKTIHGVERVCWGETEDKKAPEELSGACRDDGDFHFVVNRGAGFGELPVDRDPHGVFPERVFPVSAAGPQPCQERAPAGG